MEKFTLENKLTIALRMFFSTFLMLALIAFSNMALGDNLNTATGVGSSTTAAVDTYVDVASATLDIGSATSDVNSVMVIATFEMTPSEALNNSRDASFRIKDATNTQYSNVILRTLDGSKNGDKGIGSLVYIFDVINLADK